MYLNTLATKLWEARHKTTHTPTRFVTGAGDDDEEPTKPPPTRKRPRDPPTAEAEERVIHAAVTQEYKRAHPDASHEIKGLEEDAARLVQPTRAAQQELSRIDQQFERFQLVFEQTPDPRKDPIAHAQAAPANPKGRVTHTYTVSRVVFEMLFPKSVVFAMATWDQRLEQHVEGKRETSRMQDVGQVESKEKEEKHMRDVSEPHASTFDIQDPTLPSALIQTKLQRRFEHADQRDDALSAHAILAVHRITDNMVPPPPPPTHLTPEPYPLRTRILSTTLKMLSDLVSAEENVPKFTIQYCPLAAATALPHDSFVYPLDPKLVIDLLGLLSSLAKTYQDEIEQSLLNAIQTTCRRALQDVPWTQKLRMLDSCAKLGLDLLAACLVFNQFNGSVIHLTKYSGLCAFSFLGSMSTRDLCETFQPRGAYQVLALRHLARSTLTWRKDEDSQVAAITDYFRKEKGLPAIRDKALAIEAAVEARRARLTSTKFEDATDQRIATERTAFARQPARAFNESINDIVDRLITPAVMTDIVTPAGEDGDTERLVYLNTHAYPSPLPHFFSPNVTLPTTLQEYTDRHGRHPFGFSYRRWNKILAHTTHTLQLDPWDHFYSTLLPVIVRDDLRRNKDLLLLDFVSYNTLPIATEYLDELVFIIQNVRPSLSKLIRTAMHAHAEFLDGQTIGLLIMLNVVSLDATREFVLARAKYTKYMDRDDGMIATTRVMTHQGVLVSIEPGEDYHDVAELKQAAVPDFETRLNRLREQRDLPGFEARVLAALGDMQTRAETSTELVLEYMLELGPALDEISDILWCRTEAAQVLRTVFSEHESGRCEFVVRAAAERFLAFYMEVRENATSWPTTRVRGWHVDDKSHASFPGEPELPEFESDDTITELLVKYATFVRTCMATLPLLEQSVMVLCAPRPKLTKCSPFDLLRPYIDRFILYEEIFVATEPVDSAISQTMVNALLYNTMAQCCHTGYVEMVQTLLDKYHVGCFTAPLLFAPQVPDESVLQLQAANAGERIINRTYPDQRYRNPLEEWFMQNQQLNGIYCGVLARRARVQVFTGTEQHLKNRFRFSDKSIPEKIATRVLLLPTSEKKPELRPRFGLLERVAISRVRALQKSVANECDVHSPLLTDGMTPVTWNILRFHAGDVVRGRASAETKAPLAAMQEFEGNPSARFIMQAYRGSIVVHIVRDKPDRLFSWWITKVPWEHAKEMLRVFDLMPTAHQKRCVVAAAYVTAVTRADDHEHPLSTMRCKYPYLVSVVVSRYDKAAFLRFILSLSDTEQEDVRRVIHTQHVIQDVPDDLGIPTFYSKQPRGRFIHVRRSGFSFKFKYAMSPHLERVLDLFPRDTVMNPGDYAEPFFFLGTEKPYLRGARVCLSPTWANPTAMLFWIRKAFADLRPANGIAGAAFVEAVETLVTFLHCLFAESNVSFPTTAALQVIPLLLPTDMGDAGDFVQWDEGLLMPIKYAMTWCSQADTRFSFHDTDGAPVDDASFQTVRERWNAAHNESNMLDHFGNGWMDTHSLGASAGMDYFLSQFLPSGNMEHVTDAHRDAFLKNRRDEAKGSRGAVNVALVSASMPALAATPATTTVDRDRPLFSLQSRAAHERKAPKPLTTVEIAARGAANPPMPQFMTQFMPPSQQLQRLKAYYQYKVRYAHASLPYMLESWPRRAFTRELLEDVAYDQNVWQRMDAVLSQVSSEYRRVISEGRKERIPEPFQVTQLVFLALVGIRTQTPCPRRFWPTQDLADFFEFITFNPARFDTSDTVGRISENCKFLLETIMTYLCRGEWQPERPDTMDEKAMEEKEEEKRNPVLNQLLRFAMRLNGKLAAQAESWQNAVRWSSFLTMVTKFALMCGFKTGNAVNEGYERDEDINNALHPFRTTSNMTISLISHHITVDNDKSNGGLELLKYLLGALENEFADFEVMGAVQAPFLKAYAAEFDSKDPIEHVSAEIERICGINLILRAYQDAGEGFEYAAGDMFAAADDLDVRWSLLLKGARNVNGARSRQDTILVAVRYLAELLARLFNGMLTDFLWRAGTLQRIWSAIGGVLARYTDRPDAVYPWRPRLQVVHVYGVMDAHLHGTGIRIAPSLEALDLFFGADGPDRATMNTMFYFVTEESGGGAASPETLRQAWNKARAFARQNMPEHLVWTKRE